MSILPKIPFVHNFNITGISGVWELSVTENGYVTRIVTIEILEDLLKHCRKNGIRLPVIVFCDRFKGHYGLEIAEFCAQNQIKMIFLKPNTTHACQPLDVTCFAPLKALIKKLSHEWHGKPENTNRKLDKYSVMKEVTYQAIEKVFSNPKTVPSGFRRSGLLPFGPENMDWAKFSSSQVFERPGRRDEQSVNNNSTALAPEFCGNAVDVADPAFLPHPLPLVTTDPLLSQLSPLPRVCEAPTQPHEDTPPANLDIEDVDHVEYLLKTRENLQNKDLTQKLASAMVYTDVGKNMPGMLKPLRDKLQEKDIFNTGMLKEQDLIQAFAKSYADRIICEAFKETLDGKYGDVDPSTVPVLNKILHLHLLATLEKDLPTFLGAGLLNSSQAEAVVTINRRLCAELAPSALALIETFGLPEEMLQSPIASDWIGYNAYDNQGELQTREEFENVLKA